MVIPPNTNSQLAPAMLPHQHDGRGPMPLHWRIWRWGAGMTPAGLVPVGTLAAAAWVRLDYITRRSPYLAGEMPPPMRAVGAHVTIAGPAALDDVLAAAWEGAAHTPIAIEMWSQRPLTGQGQLHRGGRTHVYALLPLLRADADQQHRAPTATIEGHSYPARRFRAEPGNAWGTGPLPCRYDTDRRDLAHLPYPVPPNHMWHLSTTDLPPRDALALSPNGPGQVHHADQ